MFFVRILYDVAKFWLIFASVRLCLQPTRLELSLKSRRGGCAGEAALAANWFANPQTPSLRGGVQSASSLTHCSSSKNESRITSPGKVRMLLSRIRIFSLACICLPSEEAGPGESPGDRYCMMYSPQRVHFARMWCPTIQFKKKMQSTCLGDGDHVNC